MKRIFEGFGIACFVAHDDIEPTEEWLDTIEKALFSSDALIALLTKDFPNSEWTDQEVGIAIGREIPIFPVMLEKNFHPYGFIGKIQAFKPTEYVVDKFLEKFILNKRTSSPTINSFLNVIKSDQDSVNLDKMIDLLLKTTKLSWKSRQKEIFREIFYSSFVMFTNEKAIRLHEMLGLQKESQTTSSLDLDEEIPF